MLTTTDTDKSVVTRKVLLAEDDPITLQIHKRFLEKMGFEVTCAVDGEETWEKYQSNYADYNLIILDGSMPYKSGFELAKLIRSHEKELGLTRMPLILISAHLHEQVKNWCEEADIDNFEIKPIEFEDLENLILCCLSK